MVKACAMELGKDTAQRDVCKKWHYKQDTRKDMYIAELFTRLS